MNAADEINRFNPEAKVIILLRDPVGMLPSLHQQLLFVGEESITDFECALEAEQGRKKEAAYKGLEYAAPAKTYYRERAYYAPQVKRYFESLGKDRVKVFLYDDLKNDSVGLLQEACRFLEIDDSFEFLVEIKNPNKKPKIYGLHHFYLNLPSPISWLWRSMPKKMRFNLKQKILKANTRFEPRDPISTELENTIRNEMAPSVIELQKLLNRDMSAWLPK